MQTLIELYDERAIENMIGPEVFRPHRVIYLCPAEIAQDRHSQNVLKNFLCARGLKLDVEFLSVSLFKADHVLKQLRTLSASCGDAAMDVTGGTDAALVASGMFCSETGIPTFTYSRKRNRFYNISNAPFAENLPCSINYSVEDFFAMTGGTMRKGRVDNAILHNYLSYFEEFFRIFLRYRNGWNEQITFMQRISQYPRGENIPLQVEGASTQKGEHGSRVKANSEFLKDLEQIGFLKNLRETDGQISFAFKDAAVRSWLRDVGSVLELYMYKACIDANIFHDVVSSAVVDWDGTVGHDSVSNEIDVVAARGVVPLFISCKACEVKTEALNELSILKERFGGKGAKAAIVTTEPCCAAARHRASQLGIAVIDLEELKSGRAADRLRVIMKVDEELK